MITNPEEQVSFYTSHIQSPKYQEVMRRMGYTSADLQEINLSAVEKESKEFMKTLSAQDKEFYLKKKYEALVQRRHKIINEVNEEYDYEVNSNQSAMHNISFFTDRSYQRQQPALVLNSLTSQQQSFFERENKFYEKVGRIRQRKLLYNERLQSNQINNSEHTKLIQEAHEDLSHSLGQRSIQSSPGRSRSEERRRKVYQSFLHIQEQEATNKWSKLSLKLKEDKTKIQKVHRNLKNLSLEKRSKTKKVFESVARNKIQVHREIASDIENKRVRLSLQMKKFSENRNQQLQERDKHLRMQRSLFEKREKQAEDYFYNIVEKERMECNKELEERLAKAQQNKEEVEKERQRQVQLMARLNRQKEIKANRTKRSLEISKQLSVKKMYQTYTGQLKQVIQARDRNVKQVKTKLLEERIKQQVALRNVEVQKRQQKYRIQKIKEHLQQKSSTIDVILKAKERLISDRRVFLGKTLKKIELIDKNFNYRTMSHDKSQQTTVQCSRNLTARSRFRQSRTANTPEQY